MITIREIQKRLAEALKTCGLSQTAIGKKLGVSQQTVSHYVKGDKMPSLETFANICSVLDLDPFDILGIDKTKT